MASPALTLDPAKFSDPSLTARGEARAAVGLGALRTLWFNTGSRCNISCRECYVDSGPRDDRLAYLSVADVLPYLDEVEERDGVVAEIGFTGGEPFMTPHILPLLSLCLERGFGVLVLTNAMAPLRRHRTALAEIGHRFGRRLAVRVSLDHYTAERHESLRGPGTFAQALEGLQWLVEGGFRVSVAGRARWDESDQSLRQGFARLLGRLAVPVDAADPASLVLFPEMTPGRDVPEITTACWGILGKAPETVMCASSRMVLRRTGAEAPVVVACTLLPHDPRFELGATLAEANRPVPLVHPYCAQFCVLGGGACSIG
ncbi:MAG: radical SAM protein [Alphaproteobacteria bacterium]